MWKRNVETKLVFPFDGNTSRWPVDQRVAEQRGAKARRNEGEKKGEKKKEENQPACARTHSKTESTFGRRAIWRRYTSENVKSVPRVRELWNAPAVHVPSFDECTSEKPREMFIIGIVGPFPLSPLRYPQHTRE